MIFDFIMETSVIASFLIVLILIIQKVFKNSIAPHIGYYLWIVLIIKLLIPINISSNVSLERFIDVKPVKTQQIKYDYFKVITKEIETQDKINQNINVKDLWFIVVSMIFCYGLFLYIKLMVNIKKSKEITDLRYREMLNRCRKQLNIKTKVKIIEAKFIQSPAIVGIFRPVILMPANLLENMSDKNIKFVLLHELTHFKFGDVVINMLLQVVKVLYFFNPLIYFATRKVKDECEIACDYRVLKHIGKEEFKNYGNALIDLSTNEYKKEYIPLSIGIAMNKNELKRRIIMIGKNNKFGKKQVIAGVGALLMVGAVGLTTYADGKDAKESTKIESEIN
ncbi:MAG: M56 family metallopeptidase [Sarcina sp.]